MLTALIILFLTVILLISGKIRSDLVGVCSLAALMVTGVLTPAEALSGFSSTIVITMVSVFILGGAIVRTGLAHQVSGKILGLAGDNQTVLVLLIMLVTAAIGAFVSNTGTVAIMMPIVVSLAASIGKSPSRFLMPLAFVSNMGGLLTLIGNPPNMVINDALIRGGFPPLTLFSFFPVGLICVSVGVIVMFPLSVLILERRKNNDEVQQKRVPTFEELAEKYHLAQNAYRIFVPADSSMSGKKLSELQLTRQFSIVVLEILPCIASEGIKFRHYESRQLSPSAETVIHAGDVILVMGALANIHSMNEHYALKFAPAPKGKKEKKNFENMGICELILPSTSHLVGKAVKDSGLRERYGLSLLGIQRKEQLLLENLTEQVMEAGDSLLVKGDQNTFAKLDSTEGEWVLVGQPLEQLYAGRYKEKIPFVAVILLAVIGVLAFNLLPTVTAMMIGAVAVILCGCFRNAEEGYACINWESVILIASVLPLSLALTKTGVISLVAQELTAHVTGHGPYALLIAIYLVTAILTMVMGNTATSLLLAPIAIKTALDLGYSPYPFAFAVATAASLCFASPFSTPANALVISAGRYSFLDFIKMGAPLQLIFTIVMLLVLPVLFPF